MSINNKFDSVRASKDGHEFHEAWVARKCLGLLLPRDDFIGIAIEGFSNVDQKSTSKEANEIADAVLYYGKHTSFDEARQIVVIQVKYSKAAELNPFRAADAKKTLKKFAGTYQSHKKQHGVHAAREKLRFELITNRPILSELNEAILGLRSGAELQGVAKTQANQIKSACGLQGTDLIEFVDRLQMISLTGDLSDIKHKLAMAIADWSPARDLLARVRLNAVRELARNKANLVNQNKNVIMRADVLTALELQDEGELLPCPTSFPDIGPVVERQQLAETVISIPSLNRPLVIHADGGVGKTVFINSVASHLSQLHEVVLFDCFGMGQYRAPGDARHLPARGLLQIINELACRGLCDPLLPTTDNSDDLIRIFRIRIAQAAETVCRVASNRQLVLLIDAIDNASEHARDRDEPSFPRLLIESIDRTGPIEGVQLVVSSRTHRRLAATGGIRCEEVELQPFTVDETAQFLQSRVKNLTDVTIQVAQSRSRGNARILEHLANDEKSLLAPSELNNIIKLDDLLRKRIENALAIARRQGYRDEDIKAFLAGLATLPPPVPVSEFAEANGLAVGAVNSFAADLSPLLEQTKHGLMFRDEPTETLIREDYSADKDTLRALAKNLNNMQAVSVYAATTLPDLLQQLDDGEQLFNLAFDERVPATIKSAVGRQAIRHARIRAAVAHAAAHNDSDRLVHLLVELSTLAAVDQRGTKYIQDHPELTVLSGDIDSIRRLFEARTSWPGKRHARLAIAHILMGDVADAYRHAQRVYEWRRHYFQQNEEYRREQDGPTPLDMCAIPFSRIAKGDSKKAAEDLAGWNDWYAFEIAKLLFPLLQLGVSTGIIQQEPIFRFLEFCNDQCGVLAAAIPFTESDASLQSSLIANLAKACINSEGLKLKNAHHHSGEPSIIRGLLGAATLALKLGLKTEASSILSVIQISPPSLHTFTGSYWADEISPFLAKQMLSCLANGTAIDERKLLPKELAEFSEHISSELQGQDFKKALKEHLEKAFQAQKANPPNPQSISYETKQTSERFIDSNLDSWLQICRAFAEALYPHNGRKVSIDPLLDLWNKLRTKNDYYAGGATAQRRYGAVGERLLTLVLKADRMLDKSEVQRYVDIISEEGVTTISNAIEIIEILAVRDPLHFLAGTAAVKIRNVIEREHEVDQRASFFADLAIAMSPASPSEASEYFRMGLEQMDAIGSGDYQFVNELMQFASSLQGDELTDPDSHTLSNICDLNLGEEHKFHWGLYGTAMAKTSGVKGVAKLARWEDRDRVSLDYTLLPYLRALLDSDKIDPAIALTMLRVSKPAELYVCGTEQIVETIESKPFDSKDELTRELIAQYSRNNPGSFGSETPRALSRLAEITLGKASPEYVYLYSSAAQIKKTTTEYNELNNWRSMRPKHGIHHRNAEENLTPLSITTLVAETDPLNDVSIAKAIEALDGMQTFMHLQRDFLEQLRTKVSFSACPLYIEIIARHERLSLFDKLHELAECKKAWSSSSNAIALALRASAEIIIRENAFDFISYEYLSISNLKELSEISCVNCEMLILGLIREFSRPGNDVPAAVWLGLATIFNGVATRNVGQAALKRLLNSGPAKLASTVADGAWQSTLYPDDDQTECAAGLIWFALGSPRAERRWMGAESLRTAVRLNRVDVLVQVIAKFTSNSSGPFQAGELPFFYLHAQLWLLIALARIAIDAPNVIAVHRAFLESIAFNESDRHVLFKHFATSALITCKSSGHLTFDTAFNDALAEVNHSPFDLQVTDQYHGTSYYQSRPEGIPEPAEKLYLDYDFDKYQVSSLCDLFNRFRWDITDAMLGWIGNHDKKVDSMYDSGNRPESHRRRGNDFSDDYHSYGEYLCWHALYGVAGEFIKKYPIVRRPYDEHNPWNDWLRRQVLTREDGLWLSDGTDLSPVDLRINLREVIDDQVVLTGSVEKLLSLIGIKNAIGEWVTVDADWCSIDNIKVHISSALVPKGKSASIAGDLAKQNPFQAYLPHLDVYEDEDVEAMRSHKPYIPWITSPSAEAKLDEGDTLGIVGAMRRSRLSKAVNTFGQLISKDPFGRSWIDPAGKVIVSSEAWCQYSDRRNEGPFSGLRMQCKSDFIKDYLVANNSHLLVLIILRRYESGFGGDKAKYWHSTAVVRVTETLDYEYYPGRINEMEKL
ncbi:MAG: NACHT domain-containing protein [Methylotenera sp.]|nr:NACHT domain-containing protein [Methylotenera sp.]